MNLLLCFVAMLRVQVKDPSSSEDLAAAAILPKTRYPCLPPSLCSGVLPSFKLRSCGQEHGHDIYTIAAETLLGLVRVLPVAPEQSYAFFLV